MRATVSWKKNVLTQMDDIPLVIKELLSYQSSIKIDAKNTLKDFEEISEKQKSIQQEIYEKYLEKVKLKNEMDEAILNYTKCVEQYNNLCSKERDILIEKQKKEQKLNIINQDYVFDNKLLKGFNNLNGKLRKLIEENQRWVENEWNELEKKWSKWNS
ncbi:Putative surface protein [Reticulomyxa filosa]|uniref:Putative surface protein n=1 Tax=Reticulomyxa filosa TaxID=46433 RepID=X6LN45_RETFI|nr:Putative surface protein [Reticulomyxa filosa]|eukprot:ETO02572.1 Putative surface protein [Reticulomyxa filosa]